MANKKVQAQMQINVSFVGDTTKLVKQLENSTKNLQLDAGFSKQISANLTKGFKEVYANLDKMVEGLSKKGLSSKQYTAFFTSMNDNLKQSIGFTKNLKTELSEIYNSEENKKALKDLEKYKKELEAIQKLASNQKAAQTRRDTATKKMREETGIDYNISKRTITNIAARTANRQGLTKNQEEWAKNNNLDETKLKRVLELYRQIAAQTKKIDEYNQTAKNTTGQGGVSVSEDYLSKQITRLEATVITPSQNKANMGIATEIEQLGKNLGEVVDNQMPRFNDALNQGEKEAQELAQASNTIKEIFGQFGIAFSAATIVRGFQDLARSAFDFYKSLDSALNEIYVVSNLTIDNVNSLKSNFISMAKETGVAIDDVTRSAVLFYQQGLNTKEVLEMTEVTSEFAKVAGIDATDAADKLTAAVNGYCLAAEDAAMVADKFNKVAAASAADINELSTAFSKAAAQANQAGVGMDNYLAYLATMIEATREAPENIGTSMKTIMSRMQQVKEGGTTEDGETDVNQVETALKSVGIQLRDVNGELRDLEEVFAELGPKWQSLDRNTQAYLGTIIAGTRQQSRFITLMQNWDRVLDLADQSTNSAGQQALMHAKAMDSIESKMQQFQVAWQEFVSNLASSNLFKGLIEGLTKLLDLFNSGNQPIILLSTAIGLLSTKLKQLQLPIINKVKDFGKIFTNIRQGMGAKAFDTKEERDLALINNQANQTKVAQDLKDKTEKLGQLNAAMEAAKTEKEQTEIAKQRKQVEEDIVKLKKQQTQLGEEEARIGEAKVGKWAKFRANVSNIGKIGMAAGVGLQMAGAAVGTKDANAAGVLGSAGSIATAIGQFATGNWIGGLVSAGTSIFQITQTIDNWDENIKTRIDESVNAVGEALGNVNNLGTGIKATEDLLDNYDSLSKKLYRTQEEQEQLNNTIQQLGDTYGIDVLTDAYGNLSINIAEVNEQLELQKDKRDEAIAKLSKTEQESMAKGTSGLGNDTTMEEYLEELFSANAADYKTLLNGLEDGLTDETRAVSSNIAKAFASNLKSSLVSEVRNNADEYIYEGFAEGLAGLEDELNNTVSSNAWNDLYSQINFIEQNINDMSYNDAQEQLQQFYDTWADKNSTIKENWDIIVDAVNNTVFENKSLIEFFDMVEEASAKGTKDYWKNDEGTGKLDKLRNELNIAYNDYNSKVSAANKMDQLVIGANGGNNVDDFIKELENGHDPMAGAWWNDIFRFKEGDEAADKLDNIAKAYQDAKKEMDEYYETYAAEHNLESGEDAKKYIEALGMLKDALSNVKNETYEYLGSIEELYNTEGMSGSEAEQHAKSIQQVAEGIDLMGADATDADRYNYLALYYEKNKDTMKDGVKKQWEEILDEAFNELQVSTPRTLTEIGKELKSIGDDLVSINNIVEEFNDIGGMTLDTFIDLANIIDGIDLKSLGELDPTAVNDYINAIDNLNLAYDANKGYITMNGDALTSLQQIQELQTKSKIAGMIADLKASKATTETQIAYIDAQIAATDAAILAAQMDTTASITGDEIKAKANAEYTDVFDKSMEGIVGGYENDVMNQGQWSTTILSNLGKVADAWSKYFTGIRTGSTTSLDSIKNEAQKILTDADFKWEGAGSYSGIDWDKYTTITKGSEEQKQLLGELEAYRTKLENTKKSYQATLELTNQEISLLENMYNSDLSKLGSSAKDAGDKLNQYLGKLKEIYNILNRIQLLEHRLSTLDTYSDVAEGKQYGEYLKDRIDLTDELLDQYEFLVTEQKKFTNGYKDFIKSTAVADVFDFDQFGQIIINFDKYNALQDKAKSGEKSLKEQADELYDTYTSMYEELQGYFDEYIDYLKKAIDLQQEMVDAYVDIEKEAANAIKEIYQKILDDKLEAIDKEIEALEDLREARERANKEKENAKTISGMQTDIQRAMMDTSGASDIALIKAQQDMNDKLEDIAEDKYSEMLDNIITSLEEEQETMQEEFDEMFESLDWLYTMIEDNFMTNQDMLYELFEQTDDWKQLTSAERKQQRDEWDTKMAKYMDTIQSGKTIMDVCSNIDALQAKTVELDNALKTQISNTGIQVANAIKDGISSAYNSGYSAGGGGKSYSGGGGSYGGSPSGGNTIKTPEVKDLGKGNNNSSDGFSFPLNAKVTSNVGALMDGYKYDKNGDLVTPPTQSGWDSNKLWTGSGDKMFITRRKSYNGTNYYGLSYTKGGKPILWANGHQIKYKDGGFADFTGPAWLDGTKQHPEAVLNALQTEHFIKFTNALDNMFSNGNGVSNTTSSINIGDIQFHVDSMSSPEDGEAAFNMFVTKFKEIGNQTGIKIDSFKNRL